MVFNNEAILSEATVGGFTIPEHSLSFAENALYIAEAIEDDYNKMMKKIGISEITIFESTGCHAIYEDESVEGEDNNSEEKSSKLANMKNKVASVKDAVIEWLKNAWAKLKAGFEKIIASINEARKKVLPLSKDVDANVVASLPDDANFGQMHDVSKTDKHYDNTLNANAKKCIEDSKTILNASNAEEVANNLYNTICKDVAGFDCESVEEMIKGIKAKVLGTDETKVDVTKAYIIKNFSEIKNTVECGAMTASVKEAYKSTKSVIDKAITDIKGNKEFSSTAKPYTKYLKSLISVLNTARHAVQDALKSRFLECKSVFAKIARSNAKSNLAADKAAKAEEKRNKKNIKATEKAVKKNGAEEDEDTSLNDLTSYESDQLSLVESLFDF